MDREIQAPNEILSHQQQFKVREPLPFAGSLQQQDPLPALRPDVGPLKGWCK
jgi:hypothetical protein